MDAGDHRRSNRANFDHGAIEANELHRDISKEQMRKSNDRSHDSISERHSSPSNTDSAPELSIHSPAPVLLFQNASVENSWTAPTSQNGHSFEANSVHFPNFGQFGTLQRANNCK